MDIASKKFVPISIQSVIEADLELGLKALRVDQRKEGSRLDDAGRDNDKIDLHELSEFELPEARTLMSIGQAAAEEAFQYFSTQLTQMVKNAGFRTRSASIYPTVYGVEWQQVKRAYDQLSLASKESAIDLVMSTTVQVPRLKSSTIQNAIARSLREEPTRLWRL